MNAVTIRGYVVVDQHDEMGITGLIVEDDPSNRVMRSRRKRRFHFLRDDGAERLVCIDRLWQLSDGNRVQR